MLCNVESPDWLPPMQKAADGEMKIREQLIAKRNRLFKRYFKNPMNTGLAIEIRLIDDRVAEILEHLVQKTKSELQ